MSDPITTTEMLAGFGASGAAVAGAIYAALRKIKADSKSDTVDIKTQALLDNINLQLESEREENKGLRDAVERVASERNEAVQTVGRLEGHVAGLETQVQLLTAQVNRLEVENGNLTKEVQAMRNQLAQLICFLDTPENQRPIQS